MHKDVKERRGISRGNNPAKTAVMALLAKHSRKGSQVVTRVALESPNRETASLFVRKYTLKGAEVHTDESSIYDYLKPDYVHRVVNHAEAYVQNGVHANGLENYWSLLKRTIKGTHVHVASWHLFRYLDDQTYRFNERKQDDQGRFLSVVATAKDKTLTWKRLTGKSDCVSSAK
jgi:hypothetical protein